MEEDARYGAHPLCKMDVVVRSASGHLRDYLMETLIRAPREPRKE
jgi:hypothetical protein